MIRENIAEVNARILQVCTRINRDAGQVTLVAVSKGRPVEQIQEAVDAGIADIGENKVQEALVKYNIIRDTQHASRIKWHMIGHLQTNKVRDAVKIFDLIHSVDSITLAQEINRQAGKINKVQDILVEVNTSGEKAKFGVPLSCACEMIQEMPRFKNIKVKGLMTVAPAAENAEETRPYFRALKELLEDSNVLPVTSGVLSMGMSDDYEVAIEEGSTMVRLGRSVFEG